MSPRQAPPEADLSRGHVCRSPADARQGLANERQACDYAPLGSFLATLSNVMFAFVPMA